MSFLESIVRPTIDPVGVRFGSGPLVRAMKLDADRSDDFSSAQAIELAVLMVSGEVDEENTDLLKLLKELSHDRTAATRAAIVEACREVLIYHYVMKDGNSKREARRMSRGDTRTQSMVMAREILRLTNENRGHMDQAVDKVFSDQFDRTEFRWHTVVDLASTFWGHFEMDVYSSGELILAK